MKRTVKTGRGLEGTCEELLRALDLLSPEQRSCARGEVGWRLGTGSAAEGGEHGTGCPLTFLSSISATSEHRRNSQLLTESCIPSHILRQSLLPSYLNTTPCFVKKNLLLY